MDQDVIRDLAALISTQSSFGDPIRYANLIRATRSPDVKWIREQLPAYKKQLDALEQSAKQVHDFRKQVQGDGYARRRKESKNIFESLDKQAGSMQGPNVDIVTIIATHYDAVSAIYSTMVQGAEMIAGARMISMDEGMAAMSEALKSKSTELGVERTDALFGHVKEMTNDQLQSLAMEQRLNQGATTSFTQGLMILEKMPRQFENYLNVQARNVEAYYERLRSRHRSGVEICKFNGVPSTTLTDATILVWDNLDKVGEIEGGTTKDELSAYTLHRAASMVEAAKHDDVWVWLIDPGAQLIGWLNTIEPMVSGVLDFVTRMKQELGESVWKLLTMDVKGHCKEFVDVVESLDFSQITQQASDRVVSKTERFALDHRNKALQRVADLLSLGAGIKTVVGEVLDLKIQERKFFVEENSFYVCTIGTGNVFTGQAPGALEVIPGEKPNANLDNIWGGGFDEIRDFISGMGDAQKWNPLFLSTSPSKSTDKNNVLLVGPQGCGKTEIMRAIGSSQDSVAIFAVASSFLTCWLGESQKNPARLFDEAVKLHKTSGRPVHILIDEIDAVLNTEQGAGSKVNLSTEFQNLMDGVVAYPGISIWGATNHPQRIPTPMLRRFAKVLVVGELSEADTVTILKHYIETFLPFGEGFTDEQYHVWAKLLEGATGDAIRKVVDEIWLSLMRGFIQNHKEVAEEILEFIKSEYGVFDIALLTKEFREQIKEMIAATGTVVTVDMVSVHIDKLLSNFAIQQQIKTSKETYANAKKLLERQKAGDKGLGF